MSNIVLTGATSGLGLETARALLRTNPASKLFVGARSPDRASDLINLVPSERVWVSSLDTSSLQSVASFRRALINALHGQTVDGLALNAGAQFVSDTKPSAEGFDLTFATNVLGHIALTQWLLPVMTTSSIVVSTASGTHDESNKLAKQSGFKGGFFPSAEAVAEGEVSDADTPRQRGMDRYATSKLCNVMFTYAMARRHGSRGPRFVALDPGMMPGTGLARDHSKAVQLAWKTLMPKLVGLMDGASTPERSGKVLADLLLQTEHSDGTGLHIEYTRKEIASSQTSYIEEHQDALLSLAESTILNVSN